MKKRIFSMLLAMCLLVGLLPTTALAADSTGTVVWFDTASAMVGEPIGYIYDGTRYIAIGDDYSAVLGSSVLQIGQKVRFETVERSTGPVVNSVSLIVAEDTPMTLSITGDALVGETLIITVGNKPDKPIVQVSGQLYHAATAEALFMDSNKLGEAFTPGRSYLYPVTDASIGKYIGVKLTYTVCVNDEYYSTTYTAQLADPVVGGSCGEDLTWYFTKAEASAYTLHISGTGAIPNYDFDANPAPWMMPAYVTHIKSLALSEGITRIGDYAFSFGSAAIRFENGIAFPSTLRSIGTAAFFHCLSSDYGSSFVTLPNGFTTLGANAFGNCSGILEVLLPALLTSVGSTPFYRNASYPLTVYCLAEELPDWANSGLTNGEAGLRAVYGLTYNAAVTPTCVTAGQEAYYAFRGEGVSEEMAGRYYNIQKTDYTDAPVAVPATGQHTVNGDGKCTVCNDDFEAIVTKDGETRYYTSVAGALADAHDGTLTLLKSLSALDATGEAVACTVDLNGKTVNSLTVGGAATLTITDTDGGRVDSLVSGGDVVLSGGTYGEVQVGGGTLTLADGHGCRWGEIPVWETDTDELGDAVDFTVLPLPVTITAQSTESVIVPPETQLELTVEVDVQSLQPVTYEWMRTSNEATVPIADSNSPSYTATEEATYYCLVSCDGYSVASNSIAVTVTPALASVTVGDTTEKYISLSAALNAANGVDGDETVTVKALDNSMDGNLADVTLDGTVDIVLDLGGHTVTSGESVFTVDGAHVTVKNGTLKGSTDDSVLLVESGILNLESGFTLDNMQSGGSFALRITGGAVNINGATLNMSYYSEGCCSLRQQGGTLVMNSGRFPQRVDIVDGSTTLNGGDFEGGIQVTNDSVADILGEGCAYQYTSGALSGSWATASVTAGTIIGAVTVAKPVAEIGDTLYGSFGDAAVAVATGETITLLQDVEASSWTLSAGSVTLDLNGHTLDFADGEITVPTDMALIVEDGSDAKDGQLTGGASQLITVQGVFNLRSGSIVSTGGVAVCAEPGTSAEITVSGGTIKTTVATGIALRTGVDTALSGGTFINESGGQTIADFSADERPVSDFLVSGYCYYEGEDADCSTGTVLDTGNNTSVSQTVTVGKPAVASVTVGGTTTKYDDFFAALTAANGQTATVTLLRDTVVPTAASPADTELNLTGGVITLDLNGHTATLTQRGIKLTGGVDLTVKNGTLTGGHTYSHLMAVHGGTFTLAANGTLTTVGTNTCALDVITTEEAQTSSATLHGTITGPEGVQGLVAAANTGSTLIVDGGSVQSLAIDQLATVELSGGTFGEIIGAAAYVISEALKKQYAYKNAGEGGTWLIPADDDTIVTNVIVALAPIQVTEWPSQNVTYVYGESITLSVTATGADRYTWSISSDSGFRTFPNEDNTFTFPTDMRGAVLDAGTHNIKATCFGEDGWRTSSDVTLIVTQAAGVITNVSYPLRYTYSGTAVPLPTASQMTTNGASLTYEWFDSTGKTKLTGAPVDAGTYKLRATSTANTNYHGTTENFTVTVDAATLLGVVPRQNGTLTYTGAAQTAVVTTPGTSVNNQPISYTYTVGSGEPFTATVPAFTTAGEHTVYYRVTAPNHNSIAGTFKITIAKAPLTITAKDQTIVYGSNISQSVGQVNAVGLAAGETLRSVTLAPNALTVASGVSIIPSGAVTTDGAENYEIRYVLGKLTVTPASLTGVSVAQNGALTYNTQPQTAAVTAAATSVNRQTVSFTYCTTKTGDYTATVPAFTAAGEHTVYYKISAPNHTSVEGRFTVTIAKALVTTLDLTNLITAPKVNATPQTAFENQTQFTGELDWVGNPVEYKLDGVYTAILYIHPNENYTLDGISATQGFTHENASSVILSKAVDVYYVTVVFRRVSAETILFAEALPRDVAEGEYFYIDGVSHTADEMVNDMLDLGTADAANLVTYTYTGGENGYPTGMRVYALTSTENGYTVNPVPALTNALQYEGCSIRVNGERGIRIITGIPDELRTKLLQAELDGYSLKEYGTVVAFASNMVNDNLTLEDSYAKHNYAYKRGVSDSVFGRAGGLTQFTNVLTNFTLEQCKQTIAMRPYMILEDGDGNTQTIYGGVVYRSIGYIAWQNRDTYEPGTAEYRYIHGIIDYVYAGNTPTD